MRVYRRNGGLGFAAAGAAATGLTFSNPITALAIGAPMALQLLLNRKGPSQRLNTTQIAEEAERNMVENLSTYQAGPRTAATQAGHLQVFDYWWSWLLSGCNTPAMGKPGQACVNERKPGGKWDYFKRYRDPIASDTPAAQTVEMIEQPDGTFSAAAAGVPAIAGDLGGVPVWMFAAGFGFLALLFSGGGKR